MGFFDPFCEAADVGELKSDLTSLKSDVKAHTDNNDIHVTASDKSNWNNKVDKNQGSENSGKVLGTNANGEVIPLNGYGFEYDEETKMLKYGTDPTSNLNQGIGLDDTLSKTGYAADAGAVGELKEDLSDLEINKFSTNVNKLSIWEQGHLTDDGNNGLSSASYYPLRIRTKDFLSNDIRVIFINENFKANVYKYNQQGEFISFETITQGYILQSEYKYKITIGYKEGYEQINVSQYSNIELFVDEHIENILDFLKEIGIVYTSDNPIFSLGYVSNSGVIGASTQSVCTDYIKILSGGSITVDNDYYKFNVAIYDLDKNFIRYETYKSYGEMFEATDDCYVRTSITTVDGIAISDTSISEHFIFNYVSNIEDIKTTLENVSKDVDDVKQQIVEKSPTDKRDNVYIPSIVPVYFKSFEIDFSAEGFNKNTSTNEFIDKFDALIASHNDYITKVDRGICSDNTHHLYEYVFNPNNGTYVSLKTMPTLLITSAQHGFEKSSVFGIYYFVRELLSNWDKSPVLSYIRNNVIIKIIPICNPYGFDHNNYLNANGVNLNRNYDTGHFPQYPNATQGNSQYGGVEPFDQPETQIIRDFVLPNLNASLLIDWHTSGGGSVSNYNDVNWISIQGTFDKWYYGLHDIASWHHREITRNFIKEYNLPNDIFIGRQDAGFAQRSKSCTLTEWAYQQGIASVTFESFNGFVGETSFTEEVYKANTELIVNWIVKCFDYFSH